MLAVACFKPVHDQPSPQPELALSYPLAAGDEVPLLPARMVNEFVYCPRLAYLEWVHGEWAESADTAEGRFAHRRTDDARGAMPEAEAVDESTRIHARSITLASEALGVITRLDLVEGEDDEVSWLRAERIEPRPLAVARAEALPMVVQENRARIGKDGDTLEVSVVGAKVASARLVEVSQLVIYGNAYLTTPALHELMRREIPVSWHSHGGWFMGHTVGLGHRNVEIRTHQWRQSFDEGHSSPAAMPGPH